MIRGNATRHVLEEYSPPRFVNPEHRRRLRQELAERSVRTVGGRTPRPVPIAHAGARTRLALAAAAAMAIAVVGVLVLMPPKNLFARALEAASRYPVVHYHLTRRALPNQWGVVFDPRQPLSANDEVWVHLGEGGEPSELRYESGLTVGDRFVRLIRDGQILTYKPSVRWAWKTAGEAAPFLRIGPISVLTTARSLDRSAYTVRRGDGVIVAVAVVERRHKPAGTVPIRLDELKTRETFVFDAATKLLRRARIEGFWGGGWITLALIDRIEYLDFDPEVFHLDLAADVIWSDPTAAEPGPVVGSGSPQETARAFLEAWVKQDAATLRSLGGGTPYDRLLSPERTGSPSPVQVVSVGAPEHDPDGIYPGVWVPYAVRFSDGRVRRHRLALKRGSQGAWFVDGGV